MAGPSRELEPYAADSSDEVHLDDLGYSLWRHRWSILAVTAVCVGLGGLVAWVQRPIYESSAMLRIVPEEKGIDLGASSSSSMKLLLGLENTSDLQTSVGILESQRIAQAVVDSLALHVSLRAPAKPRRDVLQVLDAPRDARAGSYELRLREDGRYEVSGRAAGVPPAAESVAPGETVLLGDVQIRLQPALGSAPPRRIQVTVTPYQRTVRRLQKRLAVTEPYGGSQLVKLRYRHTDPTLAAAVPGVAAGSFIDYRKQTSSSESHSMLGFLREQAAVYQQDLRRSEHELQAFLERFQVIEPKTQAEEQARRLAVLQAEREALETERQTLAALLRQIEMTPRAETAPSPYRQLVSFPSFLTNSMVQHILQSIIVLENSRAELLVRRLERDPDVGGKTTRIQELEQQLHQLAHNYLGDRDRRLAAIDASLARFGVRAASLPAQEVELRRLSRETELLEEVYQMIETKLKEEEIRAAAQLANVQVVDAPVLPDEPKFPKPWLYMLLGGVLGLMIGSGTAVIRQRGRPTVRTHEDVLAATAGLPLLASINSPRAGARLATRPTPALAAPRQNGRRLAAPFSIFPAALWNRARAHGDGAALLISGAGSLDRLADSYRALLISMSADKDGAADQVVVVAGVDAADSGLLTAANLAIAYAEQGTPVALLDADLRGGGLHTLFDVAREPGLTDLLNGTSALEQSIHRIRLGDSSGALSLITSGTRPKNAVDAIAGGALQRLLDRLRADHATIIVAAPAVITAPETALLARSADRTLLVATAGATTRPALERAVRQLQHLRVTVEGVVLNGTA